MFKRARNTQEFVQLVIELSRCQLLPEVDHADLWEQLPQASAGSPWVLPCREWLSRTSTILNFTRTISEILVFVSRDSLVKRLNCVAEALQHGRLMTHSLDAYRSRRRCRSLIQHGQAQSSTSGPDELRWRRAYCLVRIIFSYIISDFYFIFLKPCHVCVWFYSLFLNLNDEDW